MLELNNLLALGGRALGLALGGSLAHAERGGCGNSGRAAHGALAALAALGGLGGLALALAERGGRGNSGRAAHLASALTHRALALAFLGSTDLGHHSLGSGRTLGRATFTARGSASTFALGE